MTGRLAKTPSEFLAVFAANFNEADMDGLAGGYTPDAVLDLGGGNAFRGPDQIRTAHAKFLAPKPSISVALRHKTETGDTALIVFDWAIGGSAPDGAAVKTGGTAVDVVRRGPDGFWRQQVDLPFGSATEQA